MESTVTIGFYGVLRVEELLFTSPEVILKYWQGARLSREQSHIMVVLKGRYR